MAAGTVQGQVVERVKRSDGNGQGPSEPGGAGHQVRRQDHSQAHHGPGPPAGVHHRLKRRFLVNDGPRQRPSR